MTIVAPNKQLIQAESVNPNKPASEYTLFTMGASINYLLSVAFPVGTILPCMLTETQFHAQLGNPIPTTWILADGRDITNTTLQKISGYTLAPDLRGRFIRGKDNGAGKNPDGDLSLGTYQADQFGAHNHNFNDPGHAHSLNESIGLLLNSYAVGSSVSAFDQTFGAGVTGLATNTGFTGITFNSNGGNETRAKNLTVNYFIRIN